MDTQINSDVTMAASKKFDSIIHQIEKSGLNFRLEVTPYSAFISLKKSLVKDKSGSPIFPLHTVGSELGSVSSKSEDSLLLKIESLEAQLRKADDRYEDMSKKFTAASESIYILRESLTDREETIKNLQLYNESSNMAAAHMNKSLVENLRKVEKEKFERIEEYDGQIKAWNRELSQADKT